MEAFLPALQAVRETTWLTLHRSPVRRAGWLTQQNSSSDQREASSGFHCVIPTRRGLPGTKARLKDDPDAHVFAEPKEEPGTISEHQASFLCPDWHLSGMGCLKAARVGGESASWQQDAI